MIPHNILRSPYLITTRVPIMKMTSEEKDLLSRLLSKLGKKGGARRAEVLSPEQRTAIAKKAANARWHAHLYPPHKSSNKKN